MPIDSIDELMGTWKNYDEDTENFVENKVKKVASKEILLTTGAMGKNKKQNIYDLAGNVKEFTHQCFANYSSCIARDISGTLSCPSDSAITCNGFRVTLY